MSLFAMAEAGVLSDPLTAGFYTHGSASSSYANPDDKLDPFYVPMKKWTLVPRVTLSSSSGVGTPVFTEREEDEAGSSLDLVPGAMLIYGAPAHDHLYIDTGARVPIMHSGAGNGEIGYLVKVGGVKKMGRTEIRSHVGYNREELGNRGLKETYLSEGNLEYRLSAKTSVGVLGNVELHRYDNKRYIGYKRYYGAGRFYRKLTAKSQWYVQAGTGIDKMDSAKVGVYGDAQFNDLAFGVRSDPTSKTSVAGQLGYRWRTYDDATIADVGSWVASFWAQTTPFEFSTFYTELSADIVPDSTGRGDSVTDKRLSVGVNRRLFTDRVTGDARVMVGSIDSTEAGEQIARNYWGINMGVDWMLKQGLSVGASYSYTEREAPSEENPDSKTDLLGVRMSWNY